MQEMNLLYIIYSLRLHTIHLHKTEVHLSMFLCEYGGYGRDYGQYGLEIIVFDKSRAPCFQRYRCHTIRHRREVKNAKYIELYKENQSRLHPACLDSRVELDKLLKLQNFRNFREYHHSRNQLSSDAPQSFAPWVT
jgi:hypothetical protein